MLKFIKLYVINFDKQLKLSDFNFTTKNIWLQMLFVHIVGLLTQFLMSSPFINRPLSLDNVISFYTFIALALLFPIYLVFSSKFFISLLESVKKYIFPTKMDPLVLRAQIEIANKRLESEEYKTRLEVSKFLGESEKVSGIRFADRIKLIKANSATLEKKYNIDPSKLLTKKPENAPRNLRSYLESVFNKEVLGIFDSSSSAHGQSLATDFMAPASVEARSIFELYHSVNLILMTIAVTLVVAAGLALLVYVLKLVVDENKTMAQIESARAKKIKRLLWVKNFKWNSEKTLGDRFVWINFICDEKNFERYFTTSVGSVFWVYYSKLEFIWTLVPCIILLFISLPSFTLALALDEAHKPAEWIKVVGNQWFWVYEYSTYKHNVVLFSNIVQGNELNERALRVLAVDNHIVIRQNKFTRFLITSADVIHSWAVPAMGIKVDACPGRINAVTVLPLRAGVYYGQCSEICGVNHGFMPICVEVVAG